MQAINELGYRVDGRLPHELRGIRCSFGVQPAADGSAHYEHGNSVIIASVFGPHEVWTLLEYKTI